MVVDRPERAGGPDSRVTELLPDQGFFRIKRVIHVRVNNSSIKIVLGDNAVYSRCVGVLTAVRGRMLFLA